MTDYVKFYVSGMNDDKSAKSVRELLSKGLGVPTDDIEIDLNAHSMIARVEDDFDPESDAVSETLYQLRREGFPTQIV